MEKNNYPYIIIALIIIFFLVGAYKVYDDHIEKTYLVLEKEIKEAALKCYLEKACIDKITLNDLIEKNYLTEVIDPITKEEVNKNKCISYENEEVIFCD